MDPSDSKHCLPPESSVLYSIYVKDHSFETYLSLCPTMLFFTLFDGEGLHLKTNQVSSKMNKLILNSNKPVQKSKLACWSKPASQFLNRCLYLEKFSSEKIPHIQAKLRKNFVQHAGSQLYAMGFRKYQDSIHKNKKYSRV